MKGGLSVTSSHPLIMDLNSAPCRQVAAGTMYVQPYKPRTVFVESYKRLTLEQLHYCTTDSFSHSRQYSAERILNLGRVGIVTVTVTNLGEELSLSASTLSHSIRPVK